MNNSRLFMIDAARGMAVFLMIMVHTVLIYGDIDLQEGSNVGKVFQLLGQCTAAFLMTMGFSFVITRHTTIQYAFKRGIQTLIAGYVLNSFKYVIPLMLGILPKEYLAAYEMAYPLAYPEYRYLFLTGDILQLAGISFIILGFIRHFIKNKYAMLALAIAVVCVLPSIRGFRFEGGTEGILYWINYLCDLMWGATWKVWFPVLPWICNILVGMYLGLHFKDLNGDKKRWMRDLLILAIVFLLGGLALCMTNWKYHFPNFYHTGPGGAILLMGANLMFFFLMDTLIFEPLKNVAWFNKSLAYLSKHVTLIYIVQWTVVNWFMGIFGYHQSSTLELFGLMALMIVVSLALEWLIRNTIIQISKAIKGSPDTAHDQEKSA